MWRPTRWVRAGLVYLTAASLVVGLWATLDFSGFYEDFPGGGRRWVAGDGPYNHHLTSDAGVGFLALGAVLLLAAAWMERRLVQDAGGRDRPRRPHTLFHLRHPNEGLGTLDAAASNGGLLLSALVASGLLVVVSRPGTAESTPTDSS